MKKYLILACMIFGCCLGRAFDLHNPNMHCGEDTVIINALFEELKSRDDLSKGDKIAFVAARCIDAPADDYFMTDSVGSLRINAHSFTPLWLVNFAVAMANAAETPGPTDWRTYAREMEKIACRRGEDKGFPSIMFHSSDWIGDNSSRGLVMEITENYPGTEQRTKSLDELSRNRAKYAPLANEETYEAVRMTEMGFRSHRVPSLRRDAAKRKDVAADLQNGDIVIFVSNGEGTDFYDMGIIEKEGEGKFRFIHVSPTAKKVIREADDLPRYATFATKNFKGLRFVRAKE